MLRHKLLAVFSFLLIVSCAAPVGRKDFIQATPGRNFASVDFVDIVILPPIDATPPRESLLPGLGSAQIPTEEFRQALYTELTQRLYTPLSLNYVDRALLGLAAPAEASFMEMRGRWNEDALCITTINRWDDRGINTRHELSIAADIFIIDAKTGETLWSAKADRDIDLSDTRNVDALSGQELKTIGIQQFVSSVLQKLPKRVIGSQ